MTKYKMKMDLNILNHLGLNLYSNTTAVLSEVIANAWDADADIVSIECDQDSDTITIKDNGIGMDLDAINSKYLHIGYQRRKKGEHITPKYNRPVMGRKGIGKLSLLSIADTICIHSKKDDEQNAFCLSRVEIEKEIEESNNSYSPTEITFEDFEHETGTTIIISDIKKNISRVPNILRKKLARRFCTIGHNFSISINNEPITIDDRDFLGKIQFLWPIDISIKPYESFSNIKIQQNLNGQILSTPYKIEGWLATSDLPSNIEGNNKISIITRGKLSQEDILKDFNEGGMYASYLIGEIHANFLDDDNEKDIATSNRQQFNEDDERYVILKNHIYTLLKVVQSDWGKLRKEVSTKKILADNATVKAWYDTLNPNVKKYAKKIFATIDGVQTEGDEGKIELLKYGILAFEKLRLTENLAILDNIDEMDFVKYGELFGNLQDIESTLYWDIANSRVKVIRQLSENCDKNVKEKIIQAHIYDNLWLLNPSWERATSGSERLEQGVMREFSSVEDLSEKEKSGRIDIRYKTSAGKHIIIELKRYDATYKIDAFDLMRQTDKYKNALKKCLKSINRENEAIEAICIIGSNVIPDDITLSDFQIKLKDYCRVITYDQLIEDSLNSYQEYLDREKEIGKIKSIISKLG